MEKAVVNETRFERGIGGENHKGNGIGKDEGLGASKEDSNTLGFMAGELLVAVLEAKEKAVRFRSYLEHLEATLRGVMPVIEDWRRSELELKDRQRSSFAKMAAKLRNGIEDVRKCPKVHSWNIVQKIRYSIKLGKLDEYIRDFFNLEMQTDVWHDNQQLLLDVQQLLTKVEGLRLKRLGSGCMGLYAVPRLPDPVVGFDDHLGKLKMEFLREGITLLGVCGPGGCGKSTLAAMLCRDEDVKGKFKNIFFLTVSSTPNLKVIVKTLREHIGGQLPESATDLSDEDAIKQLQYLLQETVPKPILLVLDDVWDERVIDKLSFRIEGYKMLVTSRELFKIYNFTSHSKYHLGTLSEENAMTLFRHAALLQDGNENYFPDEDLLNKIVKCCDGFPLAIKVIAKSLCGQPASEWSRMAGKLSEGSSVLDFNKDLLERLATSLDSLDDVVLECFLDLGSFREDEKIPASVLIDIWVELYDLDDEDDAYVNLLELASRSLVDLVESTGKIAGKIDDGFDGLFVTQHKLLRELAINQSRQRNRRLTIDNREKEGLTKTSRKQELPEQLNAHLVSIITGAMCPNNWNDMHLPEVEVLNLNFSAREYTLPPFVDKMEKLKVLLIVNYGMNRAKLSDLTALSYLAHVKRIRLEKVLVPSLDKLGTPMMNLHKISLSMCEVGQPLKNCTINVSEMLPNLVDIDVDCCDDLVELPPWICDITCLQKLSVTNCIELFALPEGIGCLTNLELLRLHACKGLSRLPDSIGELKKLRCFDISDCTNIKMLPDGMRKLHNLRKLDMRHWSELTELPSWATELVNLKEVICDENTSSLWEPLQPKLPNLKIRRFTKTRLKTTST